MRPRAGMYVREPHPVRLDGQGPPVAVAYRKGDARPVTLPLAKAGVVLITVALLGKDILVAVNPTLEWLPVLLAVGVFLLGSASLLAKGGAHVNRTLFSYFAFILFSMLLTILRSTSTEAWIALLIGTFILVFAMLFWTVIFNVSPNLSLKWFLDLSACLSLVVSILGIYQFFVDQTLFGIVTTIYSSENENITKRAVSLFGTPQALGIFLALNVAYLLLRHKNPLVYAIILTDVFTMILSGSKSVTVFFVAFFLSMFYYRKRIVAGVIVATILAAVAWQVGSHLTLVARLFGPLFFLWHIAADARTEIWMRYLAGAGDTITVLLGHGIGTAERIVYNRLQFGLDSAESYILKLYYEIGLIGVVWFLCMYTAAIRNARRIDRRMTPMFFGFATNLIVVHAFASLFLSFYFSAILVYYLAGSRVAGLPTRAEPH